MNLEMTLRESFRRVKTDILQLQQQLTELSQQQEKLMQMLGSTIEKENQLYHSVKAISSKKRKTAQAQKSTYVASKTGKKFHSLSCPFAKNIKPKHLVEFSSKSSALNNGYKACECMKKV
jgi:hypothetical protein